MSLFKYASFEVLASAVATQGEPLPDSVLLDSRETRKTAHRHEFAYEPKPGFLYVRSRAISSRINDNFDGFPAEEIEKAWSTFIGKPVFVNHHNSAIRRARGVIIDAALHKDANADGTPDTWVEVLMEVDAVRFPKLAQAVVQGAIDRTSMGTDVEYSVCTACGNKASTPLDYCAHIPRMKGQRITRTTASGEKTAVLIAEMCYGLGFFENSLLVEQPADPTAFTFGVDTRGLAGTALASVTASVGDRLRAEAAAEDTATDADAELIEAVALLETTAASFRYHLGLSCGDPLTYIGSQSAQVKVGDPWTCSTHGGVTVAKVDGGTGGLGFDTWGSLSVESMMCASCNPNTGLSADMLCSSHAHMRKQQHQFPGVDRPSVQRGPKADATFFPTYAELESLVTVAYGETIAPAQVDTMREEQCPVCGDQDSYNGSNCQVCGYIAPPAKFGDPDLEKAKEVDLRGGDTEGANGETLQCDHCGAQFESTGETPTAVDTTKPQVSKQAPPSTTPSGAKPAPGVSLSALLASLESVVAGDNPFAKKDDGGAKANPFAKKDDDAKPDDADSPEDEQPDQPAAEAEPLAAGSTCPDCGAGTLMPVPDAESAQAAEDATPEGQPDITDGPVDEQADAADPNVDPSKDDDKQPPSDGAPKKGDDDDSGDDDDKKKSPPWMKKKTSAARSGFMPKEASRHMSDDNKAQAARNRLFQVIKAQQDQIVAQAAQLKAQGSAISFIAEAAGISNHPRLASLTRVAEDTDNGSGDGPDRICGICGQKFTGNAAWTKHKDDTGHDWNGDPATRYKNSSVHTAEDSNSSPDGSFAQTDEQALAPAAKDDVQSPGAVPAPANAGVTPDAVTDVQNSNVAADQDPFNVLVDVTAPVAGADNVPSPSDARIQPYTNNGTPSTEVGFATPTWTAALGDPQHRFMAALVLARQEIKAGLTADSDVVLAQRYAEDHSRTLAALQSEAAVIERVLGAKQATASTPVPRGLVPQGSQRVARVVPSVAATERTASASAPDGDDFLFG